MRLDEYQWSRNPRGMHNKQAPFQMNFDRLVAMKMGLAKLVAIDGEYVKDVQPLMARGVTPIVRIWRPNFGAGAPDEMLGEIRRYVDVGARWFEFYNEPNLKIEWPADNPPNYTNVDTQIAPLLENWMKWAETIISWGAYPPSPPSRKQSATAKT
jgi:hypothetical protein